MNIVVTNKLVFVISFSLRRTVTSVSSVSLCETLIEKGHESSHYKRQTPERASVRGPTILYEPAWPGTPPGTSSLNPKNPNTIPSSYSYLFKSIGYRSAGCFDN